MADLLVGDSEHSVPFLYVKSSVRPVLLEIVRKIQDSDSGEPQLLQGTECWTNVRAVTPGAAAAIEDDLVVARNVPHLILQNFQAGGL